MSAFNPKTDQDPALNFRRLKFRMPRNRRELLEIFSLYDPTAGLDALLQRINFSGVGPDQIYITAHQRSPDLFHQAIAADNYDAGKHLRAALMSIEFRKNIVWKYLAAFPELRRDIFIHVPKCAGTDLALNLAARRLSFAKRYDFENWTSPEDLWLVLNHLALSSPHSDDILVYGHMELGDYLLHAGRREGDKIFTVIRDPLELMLSQANYAITLILADPTGNRPDSRQVLECLGLDRLPDKMPPKDVKALAVRALLDVKISQPNRICFYLGQGQRAKYEVAMNLVVSNDVELVTTQTYSRWLRERWGIESKTRSNRSISILNRREVVTYFTPQVEALIGEDRKFHDVVTWALQKKGTASIFGRDLARMVGAGLLDEFPKTVASQRSSFLAASVDDDIADFLVADTPAAIEMYLEPVEIATSSSLPHVELKIKFSVAGNSREYLQEGWSLPEPNFTWTSAAESLLLIPRPQMAGTYTLRARVAPFVHREKLPVQRIKLSINGVDLAEARVRDKAILECDIPWEVLGRNAMASLSFSLPDAAKPSQLQLSKDDRQLGFAFEWMQLLNFGAERKRFDDTASAAATDAARSIRLRDLMLHFESLGENCEFGLVQRLCEAEPLGLLRFSSAPLAVLLAALKFRFEGMGRDEAIDVQVSSNGREYMVHDRRFGFNYHAWVLVGELSPEEIRSREARRVPFLARKLVEDLTASEKIFVFHGMKPLNYSQALELHAAINAYGGSTLMWVELADNAHSPGTVEWVKPGLMKAYVDRFAPGENAHDLSLGSWVAVCREAYGLVLTNLRSTISPMSTDAVSKMAPEPRATKPSKPRRTAASAAK